MKRNFVASAALLTAVTVAASFAANPARAGLEIKLVSGSNTYTQSGSTPLLVSKTIGNFTTSADIGTSTINPTSIDLASVDISSVAGGTLVVTLSANGFTSTIGAANWLSQFSATFVSGAATITQQTYLDNSNLLLGTATLLDTLTLSGTGASIAYDTANTSGPFALTEVLTITTTGKADISLDASVTDVPEPASLTMLGSAMIGIGALARRKRNA